MTTPETDDTAARVRGSRRVVQGARVVGGLAVGVALCVLMFRNTDWTGVGCAIASANPGWIAGVVLIGGASHVARAQRLAAIVRASQRARFRDLFAVNQVGLLVNYTIPARLGEAIRAVLLSWFARLRLSQSLAFIAVDRVFDVVVLLIMVVITLLTFPADREVTLGRGVLQDRPVVISGRAIVSGSVGLGLVLVGMLAVLGLLYARRADLLRIVGRVLDPLSRGVSERARGVLLRFSAGMSALGSRTVLVDSLIWSLVAWGANVLGMTFLLLAFPVEFSLLAPILIQTLVVLATAVPIAPGVLGQYHVAVVIGLFLAVPGIGVTEAKAISLIGHLLVLFQVGLLGLYCLADRRLLAKVVESFRPAREIDG